MLTKFFKKTAFKDKAIAVHAKLRDTEEHSMGRELFPTYVKSANHWKCKGVFKANNSSQDCLLKKQDIK